MISTLPLAASTAIRAVWGGEVFIDPDGNEIMIDPGGPVGFPSEGAAGNGFGALMVVALIFIIGGVIFTLVINARKYRVLKDAGVDPFTVDAQVAARILTGPLAEQEPRSIPQVMAEPPAARSVETRLAELDDLHARGIVSDQERATARAAILAE